MTPSQLFDLALALALQTHGGVTDKGGKPYILHPIRIAMRLRTDDLELMSIAILHDVIEDSDMTIEQLYREGFSERVCDALHLLTHEPGVAYADYIAGMQHNKDALRVKREDLRDNSDITRLKGVSEKDLARLSKYAKAYAQVQEYLQALN